MALPLQSSTLPFQAQLSLAPPVKRQTRHTSFPSIMACSIKQNSPHFQFQRHFHGLTHKALQLAFSSALALGISLSGTFLHYWLVKSGNIVLIPPGIVIPRKTVGAQSVEAKAGVNKPELLPKEFTTVIDVAGFLSSGQEKRLCQEIEDLEKDSGYKLRILVQNYPDTPGLAIKDFWQVDDRTIILVADPTFGNIIHFNVGSLVDLDVPRNFWSRLSGKYGNMFYWKEKGEDASIEAVVMAISRCLREPTGPNNCSEVL